MIPLVIDTDPGVDDAVALLVALRSPEVRLEAVTTVFGNADVATTTTNALRLLALGGRPDVPVAAGASRPLVHPQPFRAAEWHGADGLGGHADRLPRPATGTDARDAVTLLADVLAAATEPVTVAAIGPLTNVALLLAAHPSLAARIGRLVIMGGALGGGNTTPAAEFNLWSDPEAARRVLVEESVPTTLVPLDLTMRGWVDAAWLEALAAGSSHGALLAAMLQHYRARYRATYGHDGVVIHDAIAILEAVIPGTLRTTPLPVEVACDHGPARGALIANRFAATTGHTINIALDADLPTIQATLLHRLSH